MAVNKVILLGNLGKDPDLRYTNQQTAICSFSLATSERRKDATGNWSDHTEWHNVVTFGNTASNCAKYLKKGRQAYIEGKLSTRKWQDKEGKDRYTTEVVAQTVQFVGGRGEAANGGSYQADNSDDVSATPSPVSDSLKTGDAMGETSFDDDDIPF